MFGLDPTLFSILAICIFVACAFEFVNGFHDTANAVATVIYTNSLEPWVAVVWSGFCNFLGVLLGGIAVATGIINLLPADILVDQDIAHGVSMVMALLLSAIIWNLATWYVGLPASSSHTLIGSILGVGLAYGWISGTGSSGTVNWTKAGEVGLSLLISPLFGFGVAFLLLRTLKKVFTQYTDLFREPPKKKAPPWPIRIVLVITCTLVSFFHGSNDGQKGVGLVMLILIVLLPGYFALNKELDLKEAQPHVQQLQSLVKDYNSTQFYGDAAFHARQLDTLTNKLNYQLTEALSDTNGTADSTKSRHVFEARTTIIAIGKLTKQLKNDDSFKEKIKSSEPLDKSVAGLKNYTDYAPRWVIIMISLALGIGTMVGWKRIVTTIGEKIGKEHLTYAQGASAELVAAGTIGLSSGLGLPVSTTHVLSSGIAGTMFASNGAKNLQPKTVRSIAIAWILTLPVTILLSASLFFLFRWLF